MTTYSRSMGRMRSDNSYDYSEDRNVPGKITLYEELRLIERNENEINVVWKGAHMTLFFMAFVFGTFCTCCFHMLMHMFDNKCILFPKLISHSSITSIVQEFFSIKLETETKNVKKPTDYVSTQWSENSVCYLPTYVPLVSGLAGLVWTTMFFMCSSGTSNVTGAQRHWRALPLMFIFSLAMAILCIYASSVTHSGLKELCYKLAEVTGGNRCSYTINVATLAYERRIRGVYQATRLCIASAWLHTTCWILSALLVVLRVLLAVDFTLVRVKAQLIGNLDDMLQKYEKQVDTISADFPSTPKSGVQEEDSEEELYAEGNTSKHPTQHPTSQFKMTGRDTLDKRIHSNDLSEISLVPAEKYKFITKIVNNLVNNIGKTVSGSTTARLSDPNRSSGATTPKKTQTKLHLDRDDPDELVDEEKAEKIAKEFMRKLRGQLNQEFKDFEQVVKSNLKLQDAADFDKRLRLYSSSDDESKVTEDSARSHQKYKTKDEDSKIDNTGEKYGTKTDTVRKHIRLNISDEARKTAQENQKEKSDEKELLDNRGDDTKEKGYRYEKAGYSGFKRPKVKFDYKPDANNKDAAKDVNKQENDNIEISEGNERHVQPDTPLRISDDATVDNETALDEDKSQEKEEKKEDAPKDVDKTDDNGKSDSKDTNSQDTKEPR